VDAELFGAGLFSSGFFSSQPARTRVAAKTVARERLFLAWRVIGPTRQTVKGEVQKVPNMYRLATSLLVLGACGGGQTTNPVVAAPTSSTTASAAPDAAPEPVAAADAGPATTEDKACKVLQEDRSTEVARIKSASESKDPLGRSDAVSDEVQHAFVRCTKTAKGGAWGFSVRDVKSERNGVTGVAVAIYVDASGKKLEFPLKGPGRLEKRSFSATDLDRVTITSEQGFDYDGDGEDELIAVGTDQTKEGIKELLSWVLTVKNGAIQPYAAANNFPIARVEDIDRDGRPDLVGYGPYRTKVPA